MKHQRYGEWWDDDCFMFILLWWRRWFRRRVPSLASIVQVWVKCLFCQVLFRHPSRRIHECRYKPFPCTIVPLPDDFWSIQIRCHLPFSSLSSLVYAVNGWKKTDKCRRKTKDRQEIWGSTAIGHSHQYENYHDYVQCTYIVWSAIWIRWWWWCGSLLFWHSTSFQSIWFLKTMKFIVFSRDSSRNARISTNNVDSNWSQTCGIVERQWFFCPRDKSIQLDWFRCFLAPNRNGCGVHYQFNQFRTILNCHLTFAMSESIRRALLRCSRWWFKFELKRKSLSVSFDLLFFLFYSEAHFTRIFGILSEVFFPNEVQQVKYCIISSISGFFSIIFDFEIIKFVPYLPNSFSRFIFACGLSTPSAWHAHLVGFFHVHVFFPSLCQYQWRMFLLFFQYLFFSHIMRRFVQR